VQASGQSSKARNAFWTGDRTGGRLGALFPQVTLIEEIMKRGSSLVLLLAVLLLAVFFMGRRPATTTSIRVAPAVRQSAVSNAAASRSAPSIGPTNSLLSAVVTPVALPKTLSPFESFAQWAEQRVAGNSTVSDTQGEALAWKRREAMLELIERDPAQALLQTVPFPWRRALPSNVTRHFEQWIDGRGNYMVALAESSTAHEEVVYRWVEIDGRHYRAFVYGRMKEQSCRQNTPLHGVALADKIALLPEAIRFIDEDEAAALERARGHRAADKCAVCYLRIEAGTKQIGEVGGETRAFCTGEHAELAGESLVLAADGGGGSEAAFAAGGSSAWTQGRKDVLYMRVNFPDDLTEPNSETAAYSTMETVNAYYVENSYNQTWYDTTVTPLLTVPQVKAWYATAGPGALLNDARKVARQAGFDTDNYDRDIVSHTDVPTFDWAGLGSLGGKGTWLQNYGFVVTAHELGHNAGLPHANYWNAHAPDTSIYGTGTNVEYGNIFDVMGSGNNHFGAMFKHNLDWLPATAIHTVTTNGIYRIYPFDTALRTSGRFYAAHVRKDFERDYWLEFRSRFPANEALQNGILLNWSPWSGSGGAGLLDTKPATLERTDSSVVIGRTFSDVLAGVHITPIARGTTGTEPWIDVRVNVDSSGPNIPCCLKVEMDATSVGPGQLVRFHATVADRDDSSFAYAWSFDDGTFSVDNSAWVSKSWSQPGEHVVRCEVSDMRGGRASANVIVTVGSPAGFRVSGVVMDEVGRGQENVFVDGGYTNANGPVTGFTDSDGAFVLTGVEGPIELKAAKYGYVLNPAGWSNPLLVMSNTIYTDFIASAMTNVTLSLSTNLLVENGAGANQLVLTRSSGVSNELTLDVHLSGTASVPGDLIFTPPLQLGTNNVVIPAGTNRIVFSFTPANNGTVEPAETLYVTVRDTADYIVAAPAEGRITILDDDQPAVPAVSVATLDSPVLENGMNSVGFVFTRTGSTAGALPVTYSVGGTATAGTDYATLLGAVVIPAGSVSVVAELQVRDDKDVEPNETVTVNIAASPTYTISAGSATETILDDDVLVVTVSPTDSGLAEPASGGRFTVKRDGDQTVNLVVHYTMTGNASNGVDYIAPSGSVTIPAGATSADVFITASNDGLVEGDESVSLVLTTNSAYDIGTPGTATLALLDDERATVTLITLDDEASEPGSDFGSIIVSRGAVTSGNLVVSFGISGVALAGADYVPLDNHCVIPDGSSSVTFTVIPFDDLHWEEEEAVIVTLVASTNYNLGTPRRAQVAIADDDTGTPAVGFAFTAFSALENESPGLSVTLSHTSSAPVSVHYQVIGGTATAGADYALPPGMLTFESGEWGKSIPLPIVNDTQAESDETIRVTLFDPSGATHDGIKITTYTIKDDDTASVSVAATADTASEVGPVAGNFRITRAGGTNANLLVNFQITGTASGPGDFPVLQTSATILAGATFVDLPVIPVDDGTVELDETVKLTLTSAPGGKIASPGSAVITILDANTNGSPVVALTSTNQPAAVEGGGNGAFVVTRTGATNSSLTIYLTTSGTASSGGDYAALPASVVIPAGQFSATLPVAAVDDSDVEGEEVVIVSLTARETYRVAYAGTVQVVIQDDDQSVRVDATDFEAAEPGANTGAFTFTRFGTTNTAVQVLYVISGSASNGVDHFALANSCIIPAGSLAATVLVTPLDDALVEGREQVTLTLQANAAYVLGAATTATVSVLDDEPMVWVTASQAALLEGGREPAMFTVWRGGNPDYEFTARLMVGGTAGYGSDYPVFTTNVFFSCGIASVDLLISPTNELAMEGAETISATLIANPAYSRLAPSNAVITITDAGTNRAPIVTITSPTTNYVYLLPDRVNILLEADVTDDNTNALSLSWTNISGSHEMAFGTPDQTNTTASFTNGGGVYVLRLIADDGESSGYGEVTVVVGAFSHLTNNAAKGDLLHWTFNAGSGTNVLDVSGHARHGAIQGAATWVTNGIEGGALNLSGTNNFVRTLNDSGFLNGQTSFSVLCWINPAAVPTTRGLLLADESGSLPTLSLATRTIASCGTATNVIEGSLTTSCDTGKQVSASNALTNGWEHIAMTWSNGLAPSLYFNGRLDQPGRHQVPLRGELVNCPQFIVGKGPLDIAATWAGLVDEVRVFPWALSEVEVGAFVAANFGAIVQVPTNIVVPVVTPVDLTGVVTDDARPLPPGTVTLMWNQVSGPLPVSIPDPGALTNSVSFTQSGDYVFRLVADDGQVKVYEDLPVTVVEPTQVSVVATDGDAAEFGPDTGELQFMRVGDLGVPITLFFTLGGTAANGVDFVYLNLTNSVIFPVGVDSITYPITPFLDHRTEGDETIVITLVSNVLYTFTTADATVTIHDSPYGEWNIDNFTLEELTDPLLSGEIADYDHDGLVNFAEYAANRDPRVAETNKPPQTALELDPGDGKYHITLTYQRRLAPTDVAYAAVVSTNIFNWQTGTNLVQEISAIPDGNDLTETVKARVVAPWPTNVNQFVTIRVWLLSTGP
jgi:hypothetical protein